MVASPSPIFHDLAAGFARGKHRPVSARALAVAALSGEANADEVRMHDRVVTFASNHAGRILGGISTGQPIVARFAVKPTSSILTPRQAVDRSGQEIDIAAKGRHDPCVGIRAAPVGDAILACVLADHLLRHRAQNRDAPHRAAAAQLSGE